MRILYTFCFYLLLPVILFRLWWKGRLAPAYRARWRERFGFFPAPTSTGGIWVHAVSVGETLAALPMIKALQARYPDERLVVTTTTPTGSERVRAALGDSVFHVYAPYDLPDCLQRFLNRVRPRLLVVMETELWPNTLRACARRHIPVVIANARLSARSARGYGKFPGLTRGMLADIRLIAAQHADDALRFRALGAKDDQVLVTGSIKFDLALPDNLSEKAEALRSGFGASRPVWIAASTHRGEDEIVLAAHRRVREKFPEALLILVPRHPERFDEVAAKIAAAGFSCVRRSRGGRGADVEVFLGDTMGELMLLFAAADIAFVGGSLVATGGHNLLEPAALGVPGLTGPHTFNFADITRRLIETGGVREISDGESLADAVIAWLNDPDARRAAGDKAKAMVDANRGALARLLDAISTYG